MKIQIAFALAVVGSLVAASSALAQRQQPGANQLPLPAPDYWQGVRPGGGYYGGWGGWGGGGYGGGTIAGSYLQGLGSAIQAAGQYNLMTAQGAVYAEQARSADIDNRMKATETYFQMRQVNRAAREAERGPRPTPEDWVRYAKQREPKPLTTSELDPISGSIEWPEILLAEVYTPYREQLEKLFAERSAVGGSLGTTNFDKIHGTADAMLKELKKHIKEYSPSNYMVARRFIEGLGFEAHRATLLPEPHAG
jgi:hypothetical protein